ncbi:hypothetical protein V9T40_014839 [Parthenolecanium corni]|uniref:Uncharacterized protein n=1 Tax=Parthenolecanium corni TaxID=536013 RepID=A0AAN9XX49_9HEMI
MTKSGCDRFDRRIRKLENWLRLAVAYVAAFIAFFAILTHARERKKNVDLISHRRVSTYRRIDVSTYRRIDVSLLISRNLAS